MTTGNDTPGSTSNLTMTLASLLSGQQIVMHVLIEQLVKSRALSVESLTAALQQSKINAESVVEDSSEAASTTLAIRQVLTLLEKIANQPGTPS